MIPIPVCFLPEILAGKSEKDHGPPAYSNRFSCLALMLTAVPSPPKGACKTYWVSDG
jgi:hypothetical protein